MDDQLDFDRLTQKQMADLIGVTPRTLRDWQELARDPPPRSRIGPFPRNRDGTYNFRGILCWALYAGKFPKAR